MKCKQWITKYREILFYLIFGVATTLVNLVLFAAMNSLLGEQQYLVSNVVATVLAILFAYVTNKLFVFDSKSWKGSIVIKELGSFIAARLATGCIEWFGVPGLMKLGMDQELFGTKGMLAKIIASVLVVIINYFFSKLLIFKKKES